MSQGPLTVVILTLNEEANLPRVLSSIPHDWNLLVIDSGSQDQTHEIVMSRGARVIDAGPLVSYAEHRNLAKEYVTTPWMLFLDADEWISPSLVASIRAVLLETKLDGFRIKRRLVFMGHPLRFGKSQDAPLRLSKTEKGVYVGDIHEALIVNGGVGDLKGGEILHYSYRDLSDYFVRFNRYTSRVAEDHYRKGDRIPRWHFMRPWVEFFSRYVLRLGFLDGFPGYTYALISSLYAFVKYEKMREWQQKNAIPAHQIGEFHTPQNR